MFCEILSVVGCSIDSNVALNSVVTAPTYYCNETHSELQIDDQSLSLVESACCNQPQLSIGRQADVVGMLDLRLFA